LDATPLKDVWTWWSGQHLARYRDPRFFAYRFRHYLLPALGELGPDALTPQAVEALERSLEDQLSPATLNSLRSVLKTVLTDARAAGRWSGADPCPVVRTRPVQPAHRDALTAEEAGRLLQANPGPYQIAFALALFLGLRKGEVLALRRGDFDERHQTVAVLRTYDAEPEASRPRVLPVTAALGLYVWPRVHATADLLFPSAHGKVRGPRAKLHERVRAGLKRAGLVQGYDRTCRRCRVRARSVDGAPGRCAACGCRLWVEPVARPLSFLDLRHSFARLADEAGVDPEVQRVAMGLHKPLSATRSQFGQGYMREELGKLRLGAGAGVRAVG
jgi:integrase